MFKTFVCRASTWRIASRAYQYQHPYPWEPKIPDLPDLPDIKSGSESKNESHVRVSSTLSITRDRSKYHETPLVHELPTPYPPEN